MRNIDKKLTFWISSYYDEFLKSRAVMDDANSASTTATYDHSNSHHGNPMNSEAYLNPRYRYAYVERKATSSGNDNASTDIYSTRYLHNQGIGNFLSKDIIRLKNSKWVGKAQPHFPSTLVANRQKYAGAGSNAYLTFTNGNETGSRYTIPVGDRDSTYGRVDYNYQTGTPASGTGAAFLNSAHLTGVWSMISQSVGGTISGFSGLNNILTSSKPSAIFRQIKSPSGMPFLHLKSFFLHDTAAKNIIHYNGNLKLSGKGQEYFTMRLSSFHHNAAEYNQYGYLDNSSGHWQGTGTGKGSGGKSPIYTLKVGFASSDTPTQAGFSGSAAIEWRWSPHMRYHPTSGANTAHHKSYGVGTDGGTAWKIDPIEKDFYNTSASETSESTTASMANDDFWHDFDFRIDWANQKYRVYVDGVEITTNSMNTGNTTAPYSFAATRTATDATGWELELVPATESGSQTVAGSNTEKTHYHTLIDRVGTYIDLSNPLHIADNTSVALEKLSLKLPANGVSQASLTIGDDDNILDLEEFLLQSNSWESNLLIFRDNINRPIWKGQLMDAMISQDRYGQKTLDIKSSDSLFGLERTLPLWDIGQQGLTAGSGDEYRLEEQQLLQSKLYFGTNKLLISQPEVFGDSSHNYKVLTNQRMRLNSAHPIQMYNLEDDAGPNKVYRDWEDYPFAGVVKSGNSPSTALKVYFPVASAGSHPLWTAANGTSVNFINTGVSTIDSGTYVTVQGNRTSYTHPNGDLIYDIVEVQRSGGSQPSLDEINISHHLNSFNQGYTHPDGIGLLTVFLDGFTNKNTNKKIKRGDYMSLFDTSDNCWDSSRNGTRDAAFDYTGVWKVLHVEEELKFDGPRTKVVLDCPFKDYTGGSGGSAFLSNGSTYTAGTTTTTTNLTMNMVQGNVDYTSTSTSKHSRAHARWMQDLPLSAWFKKTFGIINSVPLLGYGWTNTSNSNNRNGYMDYALTVSSSPPTNHTLTLGQGSANLLTRNPSGAIKYLYDTYGDLILEFHDADNNLLDSAIATNVTWNTAANSSKSTTLGWLGGAGYDLNKEYSSGVDYGDVDLIKAAFGFSSSDLPKFEDSTDNYNELWDSRVVLRVNPDTITTMKTGYSIDLTGFDSELDCTGIDGGWILEQVQDTMKSGTNKLGEAYTLDGVASILTWNQSASTSMFGVSSFNGSNTWGLTGSNKHKTWRLPGTVSGFGSDFGSMYFLKRPGETTHLTWAELGFLTSETDTTKATFCPPVPNTSTDLSGSATRASTVLKQGSVILTIPSKHGPRRTVPAGSYLKVRNVSGDYKHCWVLWSDMRNDGTADADGGKRKSEFGLLVPTPENYEIDLSFTDQIVQGVRDSWLRFNIGEDCDLWNVDALKEPVSGNPWSAQTGGSNSEANTLYHNWENKAGAFVIVDMSKFFNLNTESTGGQIGFTSGGKKDMGDYITTSAGKAALVDNYWKQAAANFIIPGSKSQFTLNENYEYWNQVTTLLTTSVHSGDTIVFVEDASEFPYQGFGPLRAYSNNDIEEEHYIAWFGKSIGIGPDGEDALLNCYTISRDDLIGVAQTFIAQQQSVFGLGPVEPTWREFRQYYLSKKSLERSSTSNQDSVNSNFILANDAAMQELVFDSVQIGSSLSERYPLRLVLNLDGYVKSLDSNTYYLSDQMRFLASMSLTDNWMQNYSLNSFWDIASIPLTNDFMVQPEVGHTDNASNLDDFGGISDNRNKTILTSIRAAQELTKVGDTNSTSIRFNYQQGRDGRIEMRPTFNSGITLNNTNTKVSKHKYSNKSNYTHVRVYYANGGSFVDFPDPGVGTQPYKWRVIDMAQIASSEEARKIAKSEHASMSTANHEISLDVIKDNSFGAEVFEGDDLMLTRGRYGYIADCSPQTFGAGEHWFGHHLGSGAQASNLFPGMISGMDGNLDGYNSNIASSNLVNDTGEHGNGVSDLYPIGTFTGNVRDAWDDSSVTGDTQRQDDNSNSNVPWHQWFYWHGARSITQAVQVVNIPSNMPLVSATTGEELRISIMLKPGQTGGASAIDTAQFYVVLTDCAKNATWKNHSPTNATNESGYTKALINGNGFVQIKVPTTYTSGVSNFNSSLALITLSVNYDYLLDLLRFRCYNDDGDTNRLRNAHETDFLNGITDNGTYNPNSIFPLGCRVFSQFGNMGGFYTMSFAPRLHIVKDFDFQPASTVWYQDANAGYTNLTQLSVRQINWQLTNRQTEIVNLTLEEDATRYVSDFYSWLVPSKPENYGIFRSQHFMEQKPAIGGEKQQAADGSLDFDTDDTATEMPAESGESTVYNPALLGSQSYHADLLKRQMRNKLTLAEGINVGSGDIFGASKGQAIKTEIATIEGLSFGVKTSGRAVDTPDGIVFPGAGTSDKMVGEHEMLINLPESNLYSGITIEAIVSLPVNDDTKRAILYCDLESTLGDMKSTSSVTVAKPKLNTTAPDNLLGEPIHGSDVNPSITRQNETDVKRRSVTLFSKMNMLGTQESGSALRLKLYRSAGEGDDTATFTSLTIHSLQVRIKKVVNRDLSKSSEFLI